MFIRIPIAASETTRFEPPALMKGKALPANGIKPTITDILINASMPIQSASPEANKVPSMSGARRAITMPRETRAV